MQLEPLQGPRKLTEVDGTQFWKLLIAEVVPSSYQFVDNNVDEWRYPERHPLLRPVKDWALRALASVRLYRVPWNYLERLEAVLTAGPFERTFELLEDDASRRLLVKLITFNIVGAHHCRLPLSTKEYWQNRKELRRYIKRRNAVRGIPTFGALDLFDYDGVQMVTHSLQVLNTFVVEQYRCKRAGIGVQSGDVVIDGGACWGDTSLYFARCAQRVFAIECMPFNLEVLRRNLAMNPELASKITVLEKALWDKSREELLFESAGASSHIKSEGAGIRVETEALDELVRAQKLSRVDFIKLDIEGAELNALRGAEETLHRFRPRLAICVYHSLADFVRIPEWLASLGLGYRLYLDHFTVYGEETILFAAPPND
jgi:FkbM family methyltransferase